MKRTLQTVALAVVFSTLGAAAEPTRERLLMDFDWRFAHGHATDATRDFGHATGVFTYFAKTGFGSGASAPDFDDLGWRRLNLPHDWAVELPFSERASTSHGFKALGRGFPESSVGWYRKHFSIPASDLGRRISLEFDGAFRDTTVWINGHYLGTEPSGYSGFAFNLTEFLNYGGDNVIAVRVDASLEEGWFYEGAGIYRHVWLVKTRPLHVERDGIFVSSELEPAVANVSTRVAVVNEGTNAALFRLQQAVLAPSGKTVASNATPPLTLAPGERGEFDQTLMVASPLLWSIETPHLHKLVTTITARDSIVDLQETPFGIRSIRFDPENGFFLNGKSVKLKATNNHQDHAGLGCALPDALQTFRLEQLMAFGCNAYRSAHNPPTPELLDACDRLGMLVIDENRLMGTAEYHHDHLRRLIRRDRNHPSIILWSIGNEEWRIEGEDTGVRIAATMQRWVKQLDSTRPVTIAISGGWGGGVSEVIEVAGMNYLGNLTKSGFTSEQWHARHPEQPMLGTEECALTHTRGIYFDDRGRCHLRSYDWDPSEWGASLEQAWSHYADRPFLAGMCIWTGFDYRGEPTPFGWPAVASQFGILDLCGFPKDGSYYLKSWWTDRPVLHVFPHWNWPGKEGEVIDVWAYSNCEEVELFLNGHSQGRKTMMRNSHLEWQVKFAPGTLLARAFTGGKEILTTKVETTGEPASVRLTPNRKKLAADGEDAVVITVQVVDDQGRPVPTADNRVTFDLAGPGSILGVGNGDPASHEPDKYVATADDSRCAWQRSLFNGLAQIIVQAGREPGELHLTARAAGLQPASLTLSASSAPARASIP